MSSDGSVTHWLEGVRHGDSLAAQKLWERYFPELVRLARVKLGGKPRRVADEEDVALSAMDSFFQAVRAGAFPNLADRHDLWRLLLRMTARKVVDLERYEARDRRGGGRVRSESALHGSDVVWGDCALAQVIGDTPTLKFAAMMADERRRLLEGLSKPDLQALAVAKMEGYTNQEIADQLECSVRTVERRLHLIRGPEAKGAIPDLMEALNVEGVRGEDPQLELRETVVDTLVEIGSDTVCHKHNREHFEHTIIACSDWQDNIRRSSVSSVCNEV
jgi:DNA-directed RNA polymerase specialized sigma24 family protein